jgi:hypothetical protein
MAEHQQAALWEVRPARLVGSSGTLQRDFDVVKRQTATKIRVTVPWNDRSAPREQEERCRDAIFQLIREIAAQEILPLRR